MAKMIEHKLLLAHIRHAALRPGSAAHQALYTLNLFEFKIVIPLV